MPHSIRPNGFVPAPEDFQPFPTEDLDQSVAEAFAKVAERHADRIAIHTGGRKITFQELDGLAGQLAFEISGRLGDEEEPVAVLVEQGLSQIVATLAILKAGKIYAVLDLSNPPERLSAMLGDLGARLIITGSAHATLAQSVAGGAGILEMDQLKGEGGLLIHRSSASPAGVYYTSGSTGQPKGVVYAHRNLLHFAMTVINLYGMNLNDRQPLPFSCSFAWSISPLFGTLLCGGTLYPVNFKEMNLAALASMLEEDGITMIQLPSNLFRQFLGTLDGGKRHFPRLRFVLASGEPLNGQDIRAWQTLAYPGAKLGLVLASTEASLITFHAFGVDSPVPEGRAPLGYPLEGKEVLIVDDEHRPLPAGAAGEIAIRSPYLVLGYWGKPNLTQSVFQAVAADTSKRIYYSNDLGRFLPDGTLEHLGRKDNLVKIRGYSVDLSEVESLLYQMPGIKEAVVLLRSVLARQEEKQLVAYVVRDPGSRLSARDLRISLAEKLPEYMVPPFFVFVEKLPRNTNEKVDRRSLPGVPQRQVLAAEDLPANKVERELLKIWKKIFYLEKISVLDSFFDLGGDSLMAISLFLYVEREFSRQFPSTVLLQAPTIRALAQLLEADEPMKVSPVIPIKSSGNKPPLFWIPSGFGVDLYVQGIARYLDPDQPLYLLAIPHAANNQFFFIEELARHYAREIRKFVAQGPYHLIGHSAGGTIACETARELEAAGGTVHWVGLLDSVPPDTALITWWQSIRLFVKNTPALGFLRSLKDFARNSFIILTHFLLRPRGIRARIIQQHKIPLLDKLGPRESAYVKAFFIEDQYHPKPYPFALLVIRAAGVRRYTLGDPTAGWERFAAKDLRYLDAPGDHVSMMEGTNIAVLANLICGQIQA